MCCSHKTQSHPPQHQRQNLRPHTIFWFPVFRDMTLFQWTSSYVGSLEHEDKGTVILWTVWNHSPKNMSYPNRLEHTALQFWHITHYCSLTVNTITHLTSHWVYNGCYIFLYNSSFDLIYVPNGCRNIQDLFSYWCKPKLGMYQQIVADLSHRQCYMPTDKWSESKRHYCCKISLQ
jgi:hypothetical protein